MPNNNTYKRDQVVGIINSVLGKIQTPAGTSNDVLVQELTGLREIIENLRAQISSSQKDIGKDHVPTATDELDAVVAMTETATQTIMEACEDVLETMKSQDEAVFQKVETSVVQIFEACTFQDITGQRIKKVMSCLKEIDEKSSSILEALGGDIADADEGASDQGEVVSLLNGPALPQETVSQDDIDKLLAEFDEGNL